jgi:hypothetical protein
LGCWDERCEGYITNLQELKKIERMNFTAQKTRYFIFVRTNPEPDDYDRVVNETNRIDGNIYYITDRSNPDRIRLKGLLILRKQPAYARDIAKCFPNFLVHVLPTYFELDFWNLHCGVTIIGEHPYKGIQKLLFPTLGLSDFLKNGPPKLPGNMVSAPENNTSGN